jgi:GNAT superfamily N-acetyltransferase
MRTLRHGMLRGAGVATPVFSRARIRSGMDSQSYQAQRDGFLISTDSALIDLDIVHGELTRLYWSVGIPRETVSRGIRNSLTFGLYDRNARPRTQVGFARVITDKATFAYLSDVFVIEPYRGRGLSKWLVEVILAHPELQGLRRFCLLTRDAHGLYEKYGFKPMPDPSRYMELWDPEVYARPSTAQ